LNLAAAVCQDRCCRSSPRRTDARCNAREGPPLGYGRKGGAWSQAVGHSRGGFTSEIHCLADGRGRRVLFALTPGNGPTSAWRCSGASRGAAQAPDRRQSLRWAEPEGLAAEPPRNRQSRPRPPGRCPTSTAGSPTGGGTKSSAYWVISRTGGASCPDRTAWPVTTSKASPSFPVPSQGPEWSSYLGFNLPAIPRSHIWLRSRRLQSSRSSLIGSENEAALRAYRPPSIVARSTAAKE